MQNIRFRRALTAPAELAGETQGDAFRIMWLDGAELDDGEYQPALDVARDIIEVQEAKAKIQEMQRMLPG